MMSCNRERKNHAQDCVAQPEHKVIAVVVILGSMMLCRGCVMTAASTIRVGWAAAGMTAGRHTFELSKGLLQ
jgi:hypothetical protein